MHCFCYVDEELKLWLTFNIYKLLSPSTWRNQVTANLQLNSNNLYIYTVNNNFSCLTEDVCKLHPNFNSIYNGIQDNIRLMGSPVSRLIHACIFNMRKKESIFWQVHFPYFNDVSRATLSFRHEGTKETRNKTKINGKVIYT